MYPKSIKECTRKIAMDYLTDLSEDYAYKTVRQHVAALSSFFTYLQENYSDTYTSNPFYHLDLPEAKTRKLYRIPNAKETKEIVKYTTK
jgi:site-specific recombinase XerD